MHAKLLTSRFIASEIFFCYSSGNVRTINVTLEEIDRPPGRIRCNPVCMKVEWDEVVISDDYRNVLFYTVSYREA